MHENELSKIILDVAFEIHKELGPGLFESVYEEILFYELTEVHGLRPACAKTGNYPGCMEEKTNGTGFQGRFNSRK